MAWYSCAARYTALTTMGFVCLVFLVWRGGGGGGGVVPCLAGVGGVCGEEHGDERPSANAGLPVLREEDEDSIRKGEAGRKAYGGRGEWKGVGGGGG